MFVRDLKNFLESQYDDDDRIIYRIVSREDVEDANYKNPELSDEQWNDVRILVEEYLSDMVTVAIDDALEEVLYNSVGRITGL